MDFPTGTPFVDGQGALGLVAYPPRWGEYHSVVAVETGDKQQSTGLLHMIIQVLCHAEKSDSECCRTFLAGALGLEPRAYGFGDRRSTN